MSTRHSARAAGGAARTEPQWNPVPPEAHAKWLEGKSLAELEAAAVQHERALYSEVILRKNPHKPGELLESRVRLQVPTALEHTRARIMALDMAQELLNWKERPTEAQAIEYLGQNNWISTETICLLSLALLDHDALPNGEYPLYMSAENLAAAHPRESLQAMATKLDEYSRLESPRLDVLAEEDFWTVVGSIAKRGDVLPLNAIAGSALPSFITTMASRLQSFRTEQSGSPSTET